ncbi:MAG: hypothetical protein R2713_21385 [Ilumatobacteraceae bacterium]
MAWDRNRPVPWSRLVRDWVIYIGIMVIVLAVLDQLEAGVLAGLLVSGPIFVAIGALLAKFGYQRKTMRQLRAEAAANAAAKAAAAPAAARTPSRPRPAPTKRTAGGGGRPTGKKRR